MTYERLTTAAAAIAEATGRSHHDLAVVLGSGLGDYAASLQDAVAVSYSDLPGFPAPRVEGHDATLYSALVHGTPLLAFSGRVHAYEGWDLADVVFGVRAAAGCGVRRVVLTNAAGGCGDGLAPGDLVAIRDHLNLTARNPLVGANDDRLGPRFPDLSNVYDRDMRDLLRRAAERIGIDYKEGVYAWFLGPSYETPAEVEMARRLGADLVGMSTVPEAIALTHMGVAVAGISLVTNLAAGVSTAPLSHDEVTETAAATKGRFSGLLDAFLALLVDERD